jgi:predicted amidohydrolase
LAGAALPITAGIANMARCPGVDLATAIEMATSRPAELIGASPARLQVGSTADLVLFRLTGADASRPAGEVTVAATVQAGELVSGTLGG